MSNDFVFMSEKKTNNQIISDLKCTLIFFLISYDHYGNVYDDDAEI